MDNSGMLHPISGKNILRFAMWAAEAYAHACFHLGFQLDQTILDALAQHGLLMLDLRLCSPASLSTTCLTLREKPTGIRQIHNCFASAVFMFSVCLNLIAKIGLTLKEFANQSGMLLFPILNFNFWFLWISFSPRIVLRDGMYCFCDDDAYRRHAAAKDRQFGKHAFNTAHLRMLMTAFAVFWTARGQKVQILDLAGIPLGKQLTSLLAPFAATLADAGARHLQWLNLSGCGIGDRGLALLLPALGSSGKVLPQLEAILLARNNLSDVQLLVHFLRSRTWLCTNCKAASLRLLDLSENPRLVTQQLVKRAESTSGGSALILPISRLCADVEMSKSQVSLLHCASLQSQTLDIILVLYLVVVTSTFKRGILDAWSPNT